MKKEKSEADTSFINEAYNFALSNKGNTNSLRVFHAEKKVTYKDLCIVLVQGNLDALQYFHKELKMDVRQHDDEPLSIAAQRGHLNIVKYLVEQGADIHANDGLPLSRACCNGHFNVVKYLVKNDADIYANNGIALRGAERNQYFEILKYLCEQDPDSDISKKYKKNMLKNSKKYKYGRINTVNAPQDYMIYLHTPLKLKLFTIFSQ